MLKGTDMKTSLFVPGRARSVWLKSREYLDRDEVRDKGWGQEMFILWLSAWFILDTYNFGMQKELKCSVIKFLYLADEDSEAQVSKEYARIYTKMLTKFESASNQPIVVPST